MIRFLLFIALFLSLCGKVQAEVSDAEAMNHDQVISQADELIRSGQFDQAEKLLNSISTDHKLFREAGMRLGKIYLARKDYAQAWTIFSVLKMSYPAEEQYRIAAIETLLEMKNLNRAARELRDASTPGMKRLRERLALLTIGKYQSTPSTMMDSALLEGKGPRVSSTGEEISWGAKQYSVTPTISVIEELNDNILETKEARKVDFVTRIVPGISLNYQTPFWKWNAAYNLEYRHYLLGASGDELSHNLSLAGNLALIDNFLFLNVADTYSRVSIDTNRQSLFVNRADQNLFTISPYIEYRIDPRWMATSGYRYVNRSYTNLGGIDNQEHAAFFRMTRDLTPLCSIFANVDATLVTTSAYTTHKRITPSVGVNYLYAPKSSVSIEGGYAVSLASTSASAFSPYWRLNLTHEYYTYTLTLNSGITYDSVSSLVSSEQKHAYARLAKIIKRGVIGVSARYSELQGNQLNNNYFSRWFSVGADGIYELTRRATAHAEITMDKYLKDNLYNYSTPSRNTFTAGIRYELYYDLSIALDYNRTVYSNDLFSPAGSPEINRLLGILTKTF